MWRKGQNTWLQQCSKEIQFSVLIKEGQKRTLLRIQFRRKHFGVKSASVKPTNQLNDEILFLYNNDKEKHSLSMKL